MTPIIESSAARSAERGTSHNASTPSVQFSHEVHEHYRALLRRLNWPGAEASDAPQTIGLTSCTSGEGVSTVTLQLAATAASMLGRRVLLVDANLRHPSTSRQFGHQNKTGFAQAVLTGDFEIAACHATPIARLSVLAAGAAADENTDQVYDSPSLAGLVEELKSQFDLVVFDLPPAGASCAPLRLAELLDGVLLVVESQRACLQDARRIRDLLAHAHVRLVGAVLNQRH